MQINAANPASYTSLDSLNFLFEFGLEGKFAKSATETTSMESNDVNFKYFAMSFRITKWMATSLSLTPYSDVGYFVTSQADINNVGNVYTTYYGAGTISNARWGLAIEPIKNISVGANLNYRFGQLTRNTEVTFADPSFYNVQRYSTLRIRDFGLDLGMQATLPMKNDKSLTFGLVFANSPEYTDFVSDIIQKNLSYGGAVDQDTLMYKEEEEGQLAFPMTLGGGLSFAKEDVYEINLDYYHEGWANARFLGGKSNFLTDLNKFAVGAEWIPDKFSIRSFINRVAYRAGFKYEQTYHTFAGQHIKDFGISFGVGLPLYRSNSTLNISAELGKRGTKEYNLVLEKYAKVNVSVSLHDLWFMQRRIE
ncbi:hypothetical protein [Draconibacterium halophilum]|uniref:Long-subunit fatty acid transport protein n=1 Tax=Draconibacterium halophilum TaxID=2706887 RepID=A0A6C0RI60_9BACT|nr:hypothetical protein [Draconibacterium halophilum]QIA09819.1 hypothetical protein G0Q07_19870 [Draconibacterium halophilum]